MAEEHTHRIEHRTGDRVTELWCWVAIDPDDDNEGIIAHPAAPGGVLLGADEDRIRCIQPLAEEASAEQGIEVKLVRFTGRQEVESNRPGTGARLMPPEPRPLPDDREAAAVEVLRRIYEGDSGYPLHDEGMECEFADRQIAAFIRKFGPLPDPC